MGIYQGSKLMSGGGAGPSPYEIAKQNGYTGTEQAFNQLLAALDQNVTEQELNNKADLVNGKVPVEQVDAYTKTETNTLLQNKAPAGFGLGLEIPEITVKSADDAVANGWYRCPDPFNSGSEGWLFVVSYGTQYKFQYFYNIKSVYQVFVGRRFMYSGTWYPWEYVNPPMELGVEYRTTERWNSKPVYVMALDYGPLPNSTITYADIPGWVSTNLAFSVNVVAHGGSETVPVPVGISSDYSSSYWYINNNDKRLYIRSRVDLSVYTSCYVYIKYTKE